MNIRPVTVQGLAGLWAGVALGGSLVAAPAKFQSALLTLPVALDVGRVQFFWLGVTEAVLGVAFLVGLVALRGVRWRWPLFAVGILAVQRLGIMPFLDARTLRVIAGETLPPSSLHLGFVVLEVAKFLVLCGIALGLLGFVREQLVRNKEVLAR